MAEKSGDYEVGYKKPPKDKGFDKFPEHRSNGAWKKEDGTKATIV